MTGRFQQNRENVLATNYRNQNVLPVAETFDRTPFDQVLAQSGCTALRIYYGMDAAYKLHAIIVAVDSNNHDILPSNSLTSVTEDESIIERGIRCPDICPEDSELIQP